MKLVPGIILFALLAGCVGEPPATTNYSVQISASYLGSTAQTGSQLDQSTMLPVGFLPSNAVYGLIVTAAEGTWEYGNICSAKQAMQAGCDRDGKYVVPPEGAVDSNLGYYPFDENGNIILESPVPFSVRVVWDIYPTPDMRNHMASDDCDNPRYFVEPDWESAGSHEKLSSTQVKVTGQAEFEWNLDSFCVVEDW